jgi:hypothetical protein
MSIFYASFGHRAQGTSSSMDDMDLAGCAGCLVIFLIFFTGPLMVLAGIGMLIEGKKKMQAT